MKKCEYCKKKLTEKQKRFCSIQCRNICVGKLGGLSTISKYGGWKAMNDLKKNNPKKYLQMLSIATNKSVIICKKENKGIFGLTKEKRSKSSKKANKTMILNNLGWYNSETQRIVGKRGGLKGGVAVQKILRKNIRNLMFDNQYYDSKSEIEISLCLQKQYNYKPKEDETLHIRIGSKEYDFLINKIFIEYHPWFRNETNEEYYNKRKQVLDLNGYVNYSLIVI